MHSFTYRGFLPRCFLHALLPKQALISKKKNSCSFMNMHVVATVGVVLDPLVFKFQDLPLSLCL